LSRRSGDRRRALSARLYLGWALAAQGQLDQAETLLLDCLEQSRKIVNDAPNTGGVMRALACVYLARNEPARAKPLAEAALKRYRISPSTADRHWLYARAWLRRAMSTGCA
jgi:hypothetical protein